LTHPRTRLETLVESFERNPEAASKEIGRLVERDPAAFQEGVVRFSDPMPTAKRLIS
jgi:hypothetical protein